MSKEDLMLSKLYWAKDSHSEMQMKDVANLMRMGYDKNYVNIWAEKLHVSELFKEIENE